MTRFLPLASTLLICSLTACHAGNAPVKIELPPETTAFKLAPGSVIANGQCLTCHSVEYVSTQPPMARTFWAGSVKKMMDKYNAPVPLDQIEALVDYLTANYGVSPNAPTAASSASAPTPPAKPAAATTADASQLATRYGCLGCHNATFKIVGPSYRDVAAKYAGVAEAKGKIAEQIQKGGSGKWGPVIMPPFPQVTEAETKALTDWILSRK